MVKRMSFWLIEKPFAGRSRWGWQVVQYAQHGDSDQTIPVHLHPASHPLSWWQDLPQVWSAWPHQGPHITSWCGPPLQSWPWPCPCPPAAGWSCPAVAWSTGVQLSWGQLCHPQYPNQDCSLHWPGQQFLVITLTVGLVDESMWVSLDLTLYWIHQCNCTFALP